MSSNVSNYSSPADLQGKLFNNCAYNPFSNDTNPCPSAPMPTVQNVSNKASELAKAIGADCQCTTYSSDKTSLSGGQAGVGVLFGLISASGGGGSTTMDSVRKSACCGDFLVTASNIVQNSSQVNCIVNQNMASSSTMVSSSQQINIIAQNPRANDPSWIDSYNRLVAANNKAVIDLQDSQSKTLNLCLANPNFTTANLQVIANLQQKTMANLIASNNVALLPYTFDINISNSTIQNTGTLQVYTGSTLQITNTTNLENLLKQTAQNAQVQTMASTLGVSALDPNLRSIAENDQTINSQINNSSINQTIANALTSVSNQQGVTIFANGSINLNNVTLGNNITGNIVTQALINNAMNIGIKNATDLMSDNSQLQQAASNVAGLDDLQNALNNGLGIVTKPAPPASVWTVLIVMAAIVVLVIVGGYFYMNYADKKQQQNSSFQK